MKWIALLRGVNVGGHVVKMEQLRGLFEECGCKNVRTYIQSGNVFFESSKERSKLARALEKHLQSELGFAVPVMLRTVEELEAVLAKKPFAKEKLTKDKRFCIVFLPEKPAVKPPQVAPKEDMEIVGVGDHEAFVVWHIVKGRPPASSSNTWLEKQIGKNGTSRFFHTTEKILEAAKKE